MKPELAIKQNLLAPIVVGLVNRQPSLPCVHAARKQAQRAVARAYARTARGANTITIARHQTTDAVSHPNGVWVTQQARNLTWELNQLESPIKRAIHDRDAKFADEFDRVLQSEGVKVVLTPYRRLRANAHCERVIKTIRHEALDWMLIFGERHLRPVLSEYIDHYNRRRPHLALDLHPPLPAPEHGSGAVLRQQRLNGLINEYHRAA